LSSSLSVEGDVAKDALLLVGVIFLGNGGPAKVGEDVSVTSKSRKAE